ncbi:MAG: biotin--[acetyl-CoA-carboxylase] ligase [Candidatus Limnocylindrales bacterium]
MPDPPRPGPDRPEPASQAFPARLEHFGAVDSTQSVVAGWLDAGVPEVCIAVAEEQRAGRGRHGRTWISPRGAGLLLSCGFRPAYLAPRHGWRLGATVALAMLDAAEEVAGLREAALGLKWPNDLVAEAPDGSLRKLGGVLGGTATLGARLATVVIGIGVNVEWATQDFPPELADTMTSLSALGGGRPVDREALLAGFLGRLEPRLEALRSGRFDAAGWTTRQRTTDRLVRVQVGRRAIDGTGDGVHPETGALLLRTADGVLSIDAGEVIRCRTA